MNRRRYARYVPEVKREPVPHAGRCEWCRTSGNVLSVDVINYPDGTVPDLTNGARDICAVCKTRADERHSEWYGVNVARIEVLSATAAAIVRERFSKKAVAEGFDFAGVPAELEQLQLTVPRMVAHRCDWSHGSYDDAGERVPCPNKDDAPVLTPVPFTLHVCDRRTCRGYGARLKHGEAPEFLNFWAGVGKVAKAAGILGAAVRA